MHNLHYDPDEGWYTVPDGVKPWGKTVRHVPQPDGTVLTQTNVPRPEEPTAYMALYVDGNGLLHVRLPDGTISPLKPEPQPEGTLTVAAASELWVQAPGTTVTPASGWKIADEPIEATGLAHDCTTWTERTEKRLALLEDAVNRIADKLTYLLIKLDGGA